MKRTSSETICYAQREKIGRPDPTAPGYVGTYTPPGTYKVREGGTRDEFGKPENENRTLEKSWTKYTN